MKKCIWIVTGSRAEYGLLRPLIKIIKSKNEFELKIIATGQHLMSRYNLTYREIEEDGFKVYKKVKIFLKGDSESSITQSVSSGISKFGGIFSKERPDLLVVLGDRFEIFAVVCAAYIFKIPIAHLHGGESTFGSMDDAFRHAITKMSMLHFVSTFEYKKRVVQLGEEPRRVFNTGAIGIDNIKSMQLLSNYEIQEQLNFKFGKKNILVTFHPSTLEGYKSAITQFNELLSALDNFNDIKIIFTKPNADVGSVAISRRIDDYVKQNSHKAKAFISLGTLKYFSLIKNIDAVIGNSSSGIIEVPSFGKPTVNIGNRQKGRIMARSVINSAPQAKLITNAIKRALSPQFKEFCKVVKNPYGKGNAAGKIYSVIKTNINNFNNIQKTFYTIKNEL